MLTQPLIIYRGETRVLTLTVSDPVTKEPADLSAGAWQMLTCEFQIKTAIDVVDGAGEPLLSKSLGSGISILAQSGETLGKFTITLTAAETAALVTARRYYDVVATFPNSVRIYLVKPSTCQIMGVVNQL